MFPAFFAFRSSFEGVGDIRPVMIFNAMAFFLNAILDYILVFGKLGFPAMGGIGAAWATTVVMTFLLVAMAAYGRYASNMKRLQLYQQFAAPSAAAIAGILRLGIPIALMIAAEVGFGAADFEEEEGSKLKQTAQVLAVGSSLSKVQRGHDRTLCDMIVPQYSQLARQTSGAGVVTEP